MSGFQSRARPQPVRIGASLSVPGEEAEEAQDAKIVLADAILGSADEPHAAGSEIGEPAERIEHLAGDVAVERVHGEVAARGVLLPVGSEMHDRMAPVGLDVAPERRHLERPPVGDDGDGAVLDPGRRGLQARRFGARDDLRRQEEPSRDRRR